MGIRTIELSEKERICLEVLIKELNALCLNIELISNNSNNNDAPIEQIEG